MHSIRILLRLCITIVAVQTSIYAAVLPRDATPFVDVELGTLIGVSNQGVDTWSGIPYAQPPVDSLRLRPPKPITKHFGMVVATTTANTCPQQAFQTISSVASKRAIPRPPPGKGNPVKLAKRQSPLAPENCLTINIQRPTNTTKHSRLPVMVYIYGGGFEAGATQGYDGYNIVTKSVAMNHSIIFAEMNYRLQGFGFLGGREIKAQGVSNLGLRDQRLALEWISDNIEAFGGDPYKITIVGESAGAMSVMDHTVINGGDNIYKGKPLFRGAIMDSGSMLPTDPVDSPKAQHMYDLIVKNSGCQVAQDSLDCLRGLPFDSLQNAFESVASVQFYQSLDLSYPPRYDPSDDFFCQSPDTLIQEGRYAKVPVIIGDQEDEGTGFCADLGNITDTTALVTYLQAYYPGAKRSEIVELVATYPENPSAGSPFRTGNTNILFPGFKRVAAMLGDLVFTLMRRRYLQYIAKAVPTWSYLASYAYGTMYLGTFHGSDIMHLFGDAEIDPYANAIQWYYISFVNYLDPNAAGIPWPLLTWENWSTEDPVLLWIQNTTGTTLLDDFRSESFEAMQKFAPVLRL